MALELYNSMTRRKEPFTPITEGYVGIYYCGPTVYSDPHLGHARGPVVFDVLRRWLEHTGYRVRLVSNITDVGHLTDDGDDGEDKLLRRAKLEQLEPMEVADKYFWVYENAMSALGVRRPDITPRATGHITEQIGMIEVLIESGVAYESDGSVYFDVAGWEPYGELSGRDPDELLGGTRINSRSEKRDPRDFALWKRAEKGHLMRWPSPWGEGYPGWHVECSAMSTKYLGDEFDIHGGGLDLLFPHHECELAQAKAAGKPFARYWLHWNMLTLGGEKMAKSKGHVVALQDLFRDYDPLAIRFHLLRSHYRSVSDFSEESLISSTQGLRRLQDLYRQLRDRSKVGSSSASKGVRQGGDTLAEYRDRFAAAMNDDLNTPQAVAALFDAAREINRTLETRTPADYVESALSLFDDLFATVLGLVPAQAAANTIDHAVLGGVLDLLLEQRHQARIRRDFEGADTIRDRLGEMGVVVEDSAQGSRWKLE
ncbi:MAG: cysteine--tRNA ligase [Trueperaceae bacterium]